MALFVAGFVDALGVPEPATGQPRSTGILSWPTQPSTDRRHPFFVGARHAAPHVRKIAPPDSHRWQRRITKVS
jgi:hypothetical protein